MLCTVNRKERSSDYDIEDSIEGNPSPFWVQVFPRHRRLFLWKCEAHISQCLGWSLHQRITTWFYTSVHLRVEILDFKEIEASREEERKGDSSLFVSGEDDKGTGTRRPSFGGSSSSFHLHRVQVRLRHRRVKMLMFFFCCLNFLYYFSHYFRHYFCIVWICFFFKIVRWNKTSKSANQTFRKKKKKKEKERNENTYDTHSTINHILSKNFNHNGDTNFPVRRVVLHKHTFSTKSLVRFS